MKKHHAHPPPGRPRTDWATRCQIWVWYWALRQITDQPDDALDKLITDVSKAARKKRRKTITRHRDEPDDPRERIFNRIKNEGRVPRPRLYDRKWMTLVELIEHFYPGSATIHDSALWELLHPPRPSLERVREILDALASRRGLRRLSSRELVVAKRLGLAELIQAPSTKTPAKIFMESFTASPDADDVAFLACLYVEAVMMSLLEEAIVFREALYDALSAFLRRYSIPSPAQTLLPYLIEQRIIFNVHGQEYEDEQLFTSGLGLDEFFARDSKRNLHRAEIATLSRMNDGVSDELLFHWVRMSPAATAFFEQLPLLKQEASRLAKLEYGRTWLLPAGSKEPNYAIYNALKKEAGKPNSKALHLINKLKQMSRSESKSRRRKAA